jgi:hypothetical protein
MLLPETKQQVMSKSGKVDELMFQAILMLHTYVTSPSDTTALPTATQL